MKREKTITKLAEEAEHRSRRVAIGIMGSDPEKVSRDFDKMQAAMIIERGHEQWGRSGNPVHVWAALLQARRSGLDLPDFVLDYLGDCAARLVALVGARRECSTLGSRQVVERACTGLADFEAYVTETNRAKPASRGDASRKREKMNTRWSMLVAEALGFHRNSIGSAADEAAAALVRLHAGELARMGEPLKRVRGRIADLTGAPAITVKRATLPKSDQSRRPK